MKGRVIVIQENPRLPGMADDDFCTFAAACLDDGRLQDLLIDPREIDPDPAPTPGTIGIAQIDRLLANGGGAFVRTGGNSSGFLRGQAGAPGTHVLVQVEGVAEPGKATPVTSRILLKDRHVIVTPGKPGVNISRRIKGDRLDALAPLVSRITQALSESDANCGVILRSEAWRVSPDQVLTELAAAMGRWAHLKARLSDPKTPKPVWLATPDSPTRIIEHWGTPAEGVRYITAGPNAQDAAATGNSESVLEDQHGLWESFGHADAFDHYGIWDEIERLRSPHTDLLSGGWMAIEATRAMVTIDINTGDSFGQGDAMTANIEAARALPRQLRLRGLGGQIIIDFAPMKKMHRKKIEEELKRAFARDPIQTTLAGWTPLGNFELQRKRERRPLSELLPD